MCALSSRLQRIIREVPTASWHITYQAHLNEELDNTFLLRLESLDRLFDSKLVTINFWERFYNSQKDLLKDRLTTPAKYCAKSSPGNGTPCARSARPSFATFLNDFGGIV